MKADLELVTASRDLQSLDLAIAALCKKFGDDVDRQRSYRTAEDRRDNALKCLASIRAKSPQAIRAKARALKQPCIENCPWYVTIATSLADDVLRYFGRARGKSVD